MFPDGPTTTTVAPPCGLCAREYSTHASASLRAVSRLISCRCARFVFSGVIVTSRSFAGVVCAAALIAMPNAARTHPMRHITLSPRRLRVLLAGGAGTAAASLARQLGLTRKHVRMLRVHVRIDRLVAHAVAVLVDISHRLLEQHGRRISLRHGAFEDVEAIGVHRDEREGTRL